MSLVEGQIKSLLAPISESSPTGIFDENDDLFIGLEDEMIKLGSLQSATIDWEKVQKDSILYLTTKCKHIRVAGYLIQSILKQKQWSSWGSACNFLSAFCETYYESCFPRPGEKGLNAKHKQISILIKRFKDSFDEASEENNGVSKDTQAKIQPHLEKLHQVLTQLQCAPDDIETLAGLLYKLEKLGTSPAPAPKASPAPAQSKSTQGGINTDYFTPSTSAIPAIANERELRKTLLAIAEAATQSDAYDPTGYMLRRYALWASISSSPIVTKDNKTELMPVSAETAHEYQDALDANRLDPVLLQKVEKSVTSSIYWFKGSYYACQIAKQLEMEEVANAIWHATVRFVRRVPVLLKLQFCDGTPFADEITQEWLAQSPISSQKSGASVDTDYAKLQDQLNKTMEKDGVEAVLKALQKYQISDHTPRQKCQLMKITADLMAQRGLNWLSEELYLRIEQNMANTIAAQWEPELYQQVSAATVNTSAVNNEENKGVSRS